MKYIEYKETKKHGTFDFPLEFYHVTPTHPRYEMSYHWHIEYELLRVLKGGFLITIDETEFTALAGDIVLIHEGLLHGGIPRDCVYECIVFDLPTLLKGSALFQKHLQGFLNQTLRIQDYFPYHEDEIHNTIRQLFDAIAGKEKGYELCVLGCLYQFFGHILKDGLYSTNAALSPKNSKRILQLKQALELIETSYASYISLDDMAKAAGMNPKYFCRFFNELTHRTPIDYLNYYRIERACLLLATTDETITEVALNSGFNDISYFIKTFKKYKGLTPKRYLSSPRVESTPQSAYPADHYSK